MYDGRSLHTHAHICACLYMWINYSEFLKFFLLFIFCWQRYYFPWHESHQLRLGEPWNENDTQSLHCKVNNNTVFGSCKSKCSSLNVSFFECKNKMDWAKCYSVKPVRSLLFWSVLSCKSQKPPNVSHKFHLFTLCACNFHKHENLSLHMFQIYVS